MDSLRVFIQLSGNNHRKYSVSAIGIESMVAL